MCVRQSVTGHCDTKGEEQPFHRPCFSPPTPPQKTQRNILKMLLERLFWLV
uniref:Uncharacterized protein n=1 Tax=Anguilla anguilla TaxID=7936 RepID=A0A0E9V9V9_ANGAN